MSDEKVELAEQRYWAGEWEARARAANVALARVEAERDKEQRAREDDDAAWANRYSQLLSRIEAVREWNKRMGFDGLTRLLDKKEGTDA